MPDEFTLNAHFLTAILVVVSLLISRYYGSDPMLDAIPTVGFSGPILSYFSAFRFIPDGVRMLKEGYDKTRPGLFKIANLRRWMVLVSGSELIDDVRRAPDDVLSGTEPLNELMQPEYTLNLLNSKDNYTTDMIHFKLMQDIGGTFKEVREELIMALDDLIPICKHSRDNDYQTLNLTFAAKFVMFGTIIGLFPKPFKPIVSRMLSSLPSQIRQEIDFIRPMVEERFAKMEEYGDDWEDTKPNDMLMWLMKEAKGVERSLEGMVRRLLFLNLASVHSTSLTTAQVLYRLLVHPEYIELLRLEVDAVNRDEGWTRAGLDKMHKLDSFLRETQWIDGLGLIPMARLALRLFHITVLRRKGAPSEMYRYVPLNLYAALQ